MRNDLQQRGRVPVVARTAAPTAILALALSVFGGPASAATDEKGAFLLIDGGAPVGQPRLTGCDRAMSDLHAALDKSGETNTVLIAPAAGALREALLRFGNSNGGSGNAVLFCGYAMEASGNVFALGSDFAPHDDPALSAVSIRAFSRVAGDKSGLVVLDLHPVVADGASVAAVAGALNGAAEAWSSDPSLLGTRIAQTDRGPGDAALLQRAAATGATSPDAMATALAQPALTAPPSLPTSAAPAAAATPPAPAETAKTAASAPPTPSPATGADKTATTDAGATTNATQGKPAASDAGSADAAKPAPDTAASTADGSHVAAAGDETGALPLTPKPEAAAPRPRVHVDPAIRRIQVALLARGLFSGRVNGVNSTDTQRGIRHFQAMLGHPVTGTLTPDETKQLTGG